MNQNNTHGLVIWAVFWFFLWSIIGFVILLPQIPMNLTVIIIFWVSGILGLVVILALQNKYPSLRSGAKSFVLPIVVFTLLDGVMYGFVVPQLYNLSNPHFQIVEINYEPSGVTGYTFYAKIRNDGINGSETVTCIVTRANLNTVSKSQTVYLSHNEEKIISFNFTVWEVGIVWDKFTVQTGSSTRTQSK